MVPSGVASRINPSQGHSSDLGSPLKFFGPGHRKGSYRSSAGAGQLKETEDDDQQEAGGAPGGLDPGLSIGSAAIAAGGKVTAEQNGSSRIVLTDAKSLAMRVT